MRKKDGSVLCTYLVGCVIGIAFFLGRLVGVVKVKGLRNFPHGKRRVLLVSNHPYKGEQFLLIALFFPGYLLKFSYGPYTVADVRNYFDKFPFRLFRSRLIPVDRTKRSAGVTSLEVSRDVLEHDGNIIMFPEGTRTAKVPLECLLKSLKGKAMGEFKPGFARLATVVPDVTVVPVWSEVNSWWNIRFAIGEPVSFTAETPREEVAERTQNILLSLADDAG